jgi:soluble lytic murein transglycosylase-like protein
MAASAQTVDDRYPSAARQSTGFSARFAAAAPSTSTLPASVPMPRPVPRAAAPARASTAVKRGRQEELMVTAYSNPTQNVAAGSELFAAWLPRLAPSFEPPPPASAALAPPADRPVPPAPILGDESARRGFRVRARPVSSELAALIAAKAHKHGVPIALAHAVVTVESNYDPTVTGGGATIGLMQIKYPTARGLGFAGTAKELYDPATNLEWGMKYLGGAYKLARGDTCGTILRYQAGHRAIAMTRSAVDYCAKVRYLLGPGAERRRIVDAPSLSAPPRLSVSNPRQTSLVRP